MDKDNFRIVFMGTPEFAQESLLRIIEEGFNVAAVITAPDKPSGRGRKLQESAVKKFANQKNLLVLQPTNLKDTTFLKELKNLKADLNVVVAFRMLPEAVWAMPKKGTINLHASLLPDYRGAAPINRAIMNGEQKSGVIENQMASDDASSSVAVIPFTNMSPDPEQEYFCEGMAEEIINSLAGVSDLRVAARSSAFQFNSKSHDAREVGAALNVKTVLEGSVRTAGRRVRVTVQLIDVDNGFQLWSDRYDREMDDIFALQDEISKHVVDALKVTLGTEAREEMKRPTASVEAYQLYLKGLHNWYKRDTGSLQKAADFFEQAVAVDPDYALAHAGLVTSHCSLAFYGMEPSIARARAGAAAERAAALAPGVAEVHAALGLYAAWLAFDWETAERELRAAVEASPSYALAHIWYSMVLATLSRHGEAIALAAHAQEVDPLSPYANTALGLAQVQAGLRNEALPALEESINIDAGFLYSLWVIGSTYGALGRYEEAVAILEKAVTLSGRGSYYLSWLGWAYGVAGRKPEAERILAELTAGFSNEDIQPVFLTWVYSGLGDMDSAFEWLEKSVVQGDPAASFIGFPPMDPLREDPRFDGIRKRLGL